MNQSVAIFSESMPPHGLKLVGAGGSMITHIFLNNGVGS
jgi:hypothetical protein